ncbi:MAG: hypothetical protein C3F19_09405 [Rhodocyclales bacterium]|nr:MAG: hypothetical protein C3F19_09405 [Rhodocyclales bacterium]
MAVRIPRYQQQIGAQAGATPTVRGLAKPYDPTGAAMAGMGETMGRVADRAQLEEERRREAQDRLDREDAKGEAAKLLSDARLKWTEHALAAKEKAAPGALDFTPTLLKQFDEYSTQTLAGARNKHVRELVGAGLTGLRTDLGRDALSFEASARAGMRVAEQEAAIGRNAQAVLANPAQAGAVLGEQLALIDITDLAPDKKVRLKEQAQQAIVGAALNGEINKARDNPAALDAVLEGMGRGRYAGVPAQSLAVAENRILGYKARIEAQQETARRRAEAAVERHQREAEKAFGAAAEVVQAGKQLSPDYIDQLSQQLAGTPYAAAFKEMAAGSGQAVAFVSQPLAVQQVELQRLAAQGNDPTKGWRPTDKKTYEALERAHKAALNDLQANALNAALERGVVATLPQVDASSPQALAKTLPARLEAARAVDQWAGREVSPLQPEEARQLAASLEALPANQRADALAAIGRSVQSPGRLRALAVQMGDKSASLATAAMLSARDLETSKGRRVAEIFIKGDDALREKRVSFDELQQTKVRAEIRQQLEGVYASETATRAAADAVFTVYAGLKAEGNSGDVKQAINLATGGVMDLNGGRIPKPYGWSDAQVRDTLRAFTPDRLRQLAGEELRLGDERLSPEAFAQALPRARLLASPLPGSYAVTVGGRMVTRADGRRFYLPLESR